MVYGRYLRRIDQRQQHLKGGAVGLDVFDRHPTGESLHELGLDYVADDFVSRGILSENKKIPLEFKMQD